MTKLDSEETPWPLSPTRGSRLIRVLTLIVIVGVAAVWLAALAAGAVWLLFLL